MNELILIFLIALIAATISGAAGFGGALILLPVLAGVVGIKAAIPILTIGQIFGNASRVWFGRHALVWKPIWLFLLAAIPMSLIGSLMFAMVESNYIKATIGVFLIMIVIIRRIRPIEIGGKGMILGGGLTGFLSGIAGSAGPLGASFFLGLNLPATSYIASEAFTALAMHLTKSIVYNKYALIGLTELYWGLFIGIAMILGSWIGKKLIDKLPRNKFVLLVEVLLLLSGIQMIIAGIR